MSINVIATPVNKSYDIKRYDTGVASMKIADTGGGIGVNLGWVSGYADVIAREIDLAKIRKLRKLLKISQETMAGLLGYKTPTGYSYLESGRCSINADQLPIIANALGVTVNELYFAYNSTILVDEQAATSELKIA
jgi:DNA-binding XRE family transcriptional regulator